MSLRCRTELDRFRADKWVYLSAAHLIHLLSVENVMLAQYFHSMTDEKEARAAWRASVRQRNRASASELSVGSSRGFELRGR